MSTSRVPLALLLLGLWPFALSSATAQDVVHLLGAGGGSMRVSGRVTDYDGRELRLEMTGGREQRFPSERVVRIESEYSDDQYRGDDMMKLRRFEDALNLYARARTTETRGWVRRLLTARIVQSLESLDRQDRAGAEFLLLVQADSALLHLVAIPLPWIARLPTPAVQRAAETWIARPEPPARLLGAAHLLVGPRRNEAVRVLRALVTSDDRRVGQLAAAQLWRVDAIEADEAKLRHWSTALEQMPESLRAGPHYVLGKERLRRKEWESAALHLMRTPVLQPERRALAAESLLDAGHALQQLNRPRQAAALYREAARDYADRRHAAAEAQARLKEM